MSFRMQSGDTLSVFPSPEFSDVENAPHILDIKRTITGVTRVYKKTAQTRILNYTLNLTKEKAMELRAFLIKYFDSDIKITNHKNEVWIVKLTNQPWVLNADQVAQNYYGNERVQIPLAFEGTKQ